MPMSRLHIFIDGSWLYKVCAPERALASKVEFRDRRFRLNFARLCSALLAHAASYDRSCDEVGDKFLSTSIFSIPENLSEWPYERENVTPLDVAAIIGSVKARERFVRGALATGFDPSAVHRPLLRGWMIEQLRNHRFQEKQVDATVVALLVRSAMMNPLDYHVIVTGDADMLPAVRLTQKSCSENVFVATIQPTRFGGGARGGSFALADFDYRIAPYYLDEHVDAIADGEHVYTCDTCGRVFSRAEPLYKKQKRRCSLCRERQKAAAVTARSLTTGVAPELSLS